jgi:hypothetical protein
MCQSIFICKFCDKPHKNKNSLIHHERLCKSNPNHQTPNTKAGLEKVINTFELCPYCKRKYNIANIKRHIESCKLNPVNIRYCPVCGKVLNNDQNKFCSSSCAAHFNNHKRTEQMWHHSTETKNKISKSLTGKQNPQKGKIKKTLCEVETHICLVCGKLFYLPKNHKRKTCGNRECITHLSVKIRPYQNGSRKPSIYFCKEMGEDVLLDSSWEVKIAKQLDSYNIRWTRPAPIRWTDINNKKHLYYPDFFLTDYNFYLDPKNPYCMVQDKEKMYIVSKTINVFYGDIDYISSIINEMCR